MNWIDRRKQAKRRRRVMKMLGVVSGGVAVLFLVGALMPAEHLFSGRATLPGPPELVWRVLTDLDGMAHWRSDLTALERLPDLGGRPAWREVGKAGNQVVELTLSDPPRRLVTRRAGQRAPGLPMRTFELAPTTRGTLVTVTDRVESGNPFRRLLVRIHVPRPAVERLLQDLAERLRLNRRVVVADTSPRG